MEYYNNQSSWFNWKVKTILIIIAFISIFLALIHFKILGTETVRSILYFIGNILLNIERNIGKYGIDLFVKLLEGV